MKSLSVRQLALPLAISAALLAGCGPQQTATPTQTAVAVQQQSESDKANALFEQIFMAGVKRNPVQQTRLGIKDDYDKWQDLSDAHFEAGLELTRQHLVMLEAIDVTKLDDNTRVSYLLMQRNLQQDLDEAKWRLYSYPVNQMFGTHSQVPSLLINQHTISNESDAKAYIARLNAVPTLFSQLQHQLQQRAEAGIIAPKFVFPHVISASENVIKGAPFEEGEDSTLLADFTKKVAALSLDDASQKLLIDEAKVALLTSIKPAYSALIKYLQGLEQQASSIDGVWRFKDGAAFYNAKLKDTTTTELTAEQIHQIGLDDVARIHDEMRAIMQKTGFDGDLHAFLPICKPPRSFIILKPMKAKLNIWRRLPQLSTICAPS